MEGTTTGAVLGGARDLARFDPEGLHPRVLFESAAMKVALLALEPGQGIELHAPAIDLAVAVLDGAGEIVAGPEHRPVRAGDVAVVPAGERRGIRALDVRLVALHVASPPPAPALHGAGGEPWPEPRTTPSGPAAAIHAEHRELLPHLDHLRTLADEVTALAPDELSERLRAVLGFLREVLLPHAEAEDAALYPMVDRVLRALGGTTRTMSIDHRAVGAMIDELAGLAEAEPDDRTRRRAQRVLDGLEALVRVHFDKEEEVYVPLLERLSPEEAEELERALAELPGHAHHH